MALTPCPECGHSVSTRAKSCPNCGYPFMETRQAPPIIQEPHHEPERESGIGFWGVVGAVVIAILLVSWL
ncbi:zinc ribbon domain-containing protein [Salisediminibacterium selenitireducens]|uniref:zinc ribbon domain-containing protein n=1 Tax=Salisediminibacterium selenitireducens TaxID=85683 RepID=UPI000A035543|nr:zinc ribbon domain-containing protein [Salisediminibacterium selenitireducens]